MAMCKIMKTGYAAIWRKVIARHTPKMEYKMTAATNAEQLEQAKCRLAQAKFMSCGALSNEKLEERSEEKERQELAFKIKPRMGSVGKRS